MVTKKKPSGLSSAYITHIYTARIPHPAKPGGTNIAMNTVHGSSKEKTKLYDAIKSMLVVDANIPYCVHIRVPDTQRRFNHSVLY